MRVIKRVGLGALLIIPAAILVVLTWAFVSYRDDYVLRALRWMNSDVNDYQKFPERRIFAAPTPFHFENQPNEALVRALFAADPAIDDLDSFLEKSRTQAFIVIQNDAVLYEKYFNGASRESVVTSFSTAKSFASALIGIAIAEGHIDSVDDPITKYLPELVERDEAFAGITIRDLLMMSSGIKYRETMFFNGDDAKTYYYPDLRQLALEETHIVDQPGEYFLYNNYHPLLLGLILERTTGMAVADYLDSRIWGQIGAEFDGSWSVDSIETGFEKMESGINGRAIDFAKFGRLYLKDGNWDGKQVVPAEWVADSTQPDTSVDAASYYGDLFSHMPAEGFYKYMWWGIEREGGEPDFSALGNHGQFIYISPQKELIIVRHGEKYGSLSALAWLSTFYNFASRLDLATEPE